MALLAAACAIGLTSLAAGLPASAASTSNAPAKDSPYAAAKDEGSPTAAPAKVPAVPGAMTGTAAPGTEKESPYAAAKDEMGLSFAPTLGRLWWLLLPAGLAAGSYMYLRGQEASS